MTDSGAKGASSVYKLQPVEIRTADFVGQEVQRSETPYVDHLIDPSMPEDVSYSYFLDDEESDGLLNSIEQSFHAVSLYRDNTRSHDNSVDYGLHYAARYASNNYGEFRLTVVALNEHSDLASSNQNTNIFLNQSYSRQVGVRRVTLEQSALPLTDSISMDNVLGMHRLHRSRPFNGRRNLVNYRFGAAEPSVFGVSSRVNFGASSVAISAGELGESRGTVLPGFTDTSGDVQRLQLTHGRDRHVFSADYWSTNEQIAVDNREGARLAYHAMIGDSTLASLSWATSASNQAVLLGASRENSVSRHEFGAYYFEPDIVWIDTPVGDDNAGAFYRFSTRAGGYTYGGSIEQRRDGLQANSLFERDTFYMSANASTRLNSRSNVSGVFSVRKVDNRASNSPASVGSTENSLHIFYNRGHGLTTRSNASVYLRHREEYSEQSVSYGWSKDYNDDAALEFLLDFRHSRSGTSRSNQLGLSTSWNQQFLGGAHLGVGAGYNFGQSTQTEDRGFNGYLNYEVPFGQRMSIALQVDYGRTKSIYEDEDLTGLFTQNILDDEDFTTFRELTAQLSLRYDIGRGKSHNLLSARGNALGSGAVHGRLFLDSNGDGLRQSGEPGIAGVTLFLNSIHPYVTDSRGEFTFQRVGIGDHFLFVDEGTLPLPLTLRGEEYTPVQVTLRGTSVIDIPVSTVIIADSDE